MNGFDVKTILAMAPPTTAGTQQDPRAGSLQMVGMMVLLFVMMYFLMIRPNSKKQKALAEMMKTLKAGDKIVTSAGIIGVIVTVKDKSVTLRSADSKFEVTKSAIAEVLERSGESAEA